MKAKIQPIANIVQLPMRQPELLHAKLLLATPAWQINLRCYQTV
jgi:hypothetical protein